MPVAKKYQKLILAAEAGLRKCGDPYLVAKRIEKKYGLQWLGCGSFAAVLSLGRYYVLKIAVAHDDFGDSRNEKKRHTIQPSTRSIIYPYFVKYDYVKKLDLDWGVFFILVQRRVKVSNPGRALSEIARRTGLKSNGFCLVARRYDVSIGNVGWLAGGPAIFDY